MARANLKLIEKLREAAANIEASGDYNWGHIGRCNCGHLARCLTGFSSQDITNVAQRNYIDEWTEFANDYCPDNGTAFDDLIDPLLDSGFELEDIHQLEYLSDPRVLCALPGGPRKLQKGRPADAALYMRTWAALLELELKENSKRVETEGVLQQAIG